MTLKFETKYHRSKAHPDYHWLYWTFVLFCIVCYYCINPAYRLQHENKPLLYFSLACFPCPVQFSLSFYFHPFSHLPFHRPSLFPSPLLPFISFPFCLHFFSFLSHFSRRGGHRWHAAGFAAARRWLWVVVTYLSYMICYVYFRFCDGGFVDVKFLVLNYVLRLVIFIFQNESTVWKSKTKGATTEFDRLYFQCTLV